MNSGKDVVFVYFKRLSIHTDKGEPEGGSRNSNFDQVKEQLQNYCSNDNVFSCLSIVFKAIFGGRSVVSPVTDFSVGYLDRFDLVNLGVIYKLFVRMVSKEVVNDDFYSRPGSFVCLLFKVLTGVSQLSTTVEDDKKQQDVRVCRLFVGFAGADQVPNKGYLYFT